MPLNFQNLTLQQYLDQMSSRQPVPGGGSAGALTASLGVALISMVANYSMGRKSNTKAIEQRLVKIFKSSEAIRCRLLELTSLDSEAYLRIVASRKLSAKEQRLATRQAAKVGREICRLCYKSLDLGIYLVANGNPYLLSDIEAAIELLNAGFNISMVMVRINQ